MATQSAAPVALIVLDGLGDRPHPATGGRSPVEAAATPYLDRLSRLGQLGQVIVVGPGVAPESDAGVFALLGYDPVHDSPGRGVLEALGVDLPLEKGDVALRLNFATAEGDGTIIDSRVGRSLSTHEAEELALGVTRADLLSAEGIRAEVRATVGHRGVLWLHPSSGGALSSQVSNADPFYERVGGMGQARRPEHPRILPVTALDASPAAARTAGAINSFLERAAGVLAGHRVNARRALSGQEDRECPAGPQCRLTSRVAPPDIRTTVRDPRGLAHRNARGARDRTRPGPRGPVRRPDGAGPGGRLPGPGPHRP